MNILAGIVSYNPDLTRLYENIQAIINQVDKVVIVDNGSDNYKILKKQIEFNEKIEIISNVDNLGIAKALNQIMSFAKNNNYNWVLTLDQDSVCSCNLIEKYTEYINLPKVGILTCNIIDRNFSIKGNNSDKEYTEVDFCITSASFMNVNAFYKTAGYDEKLFIDYVDFDICIQIRRANYMIYKINFDGLLHEVGKGKNVNLLWREYQTYNHSPFRQYFSARNSFYLAKKYTDEFNFLRVLTHEFRVSLLIFLYEDNRLKKLKARFQGILDYRKM